MGKEGGQRSIGDVVCKSKPKREVILRRNSTISENVFMKRCSTEMAGFEARARSQVNETERV